MLLSPNHQPHQMRLFHLKRLHLFILLTGDLIKNCFTVQQKLKPLTSDLEIIAHIPINCH